MRLILVALLFAISYAQTAQAGSNQYPYNNQGYPGQGGYPASNQQQGHPGSNQQKYPAPSQPKYTPPNQPPKYTPPGRGAATQPGVRPRPQSILECTQTRQEKCHMKRIKNLCDADICCVFEFKDRRPDCYGIDNAPYNQVECKDFPRPTCEKDPSCAWSMTNYECDLQWNVSGEFVQECVDNPSNPECYKQASFITSGGVLLFCIGCCCGYFLQPCYRKHEERKRKESMAPPKNDPRLGELSWDYHQHPEDFQQPPQDYLKPEDHHNTNSRHPEDFQQPLQSPKYLQTMENTMENQLENGSKRYPTPAYYAPATSLPGEHRTPSRQAPTHEVNYNIHATQFE